MGKKLIALFEIRERKGTTTTFYPKRVGEGVFDNWEDAMTHAAKVYKRLSYVDRENIVNYSYREATKKEIETWEAKYGT